MPQKTATPEENTRARLYEYRPRDGVVVMIAKTDSDVVAEKFVRDVDTRSVRVYREEWYYQYPYRDARNDRDVEGGWRKNDSHDHDFDLIGSDTDVVEHDGREWDTYARERFAELMAKRFPNYGGR